MMSARNEAIENFAKNVLNHKTFHMNLLAGDASFRRYFRLHISNNSYIIMDAPPALEPIAPFVKIARLLSENQIKTPKIIAVDEAEGFILLEDLGDNLLLSVLSADNADFYYKKAMKVLLQLQTCPTQHKDLAVFDKTHMTNECALFQTWFLEDYLQLRLSHDECQVINETIDWITCQIEQQAKVLIHRDFHSRNLMISAQELAVLDFQDAMLGPVCYDLVSLLKDCYISWPREQVLKWLKFYHQQSAIVADLPFHDLIQAFDLCGLQRHIKVAGIFSRLYLRDQKEAYLKDLPLTIDYLKSCSALYPELKAFGEFLKHRIKTA